MTQAADNIKVHISTNPVVDILFLLAIAAALTGIKITVFLLGLQHYVFPVDAQKLAGGLSVISHWSSSVLGIPLALFGTVFYVIVLILVGIWFQTRAQFIKTSLPVIAGIAGIIALGMAIWQPAVIGATCKFCMQSHMITGVIFVLSLGIYYFRESTQSTPGAVTMVSLRVLIWPLLIFAILIAVFTGWWDASPGGLFATEYVIGE